jgi:FMN phosphatase YigB (HAD superfamily)
MLNYYKKRISFDFDNTLYDTFIAFPRLEIFEYLNNLAHNYKIIIVTARNSCEKYVVEDFVKKYNLPISEIYFTNQQLKGPILKQLNVIQHIDDCQHQLESAKECGIEAISIFKLLRQ